MFQVDYQDASRIEESTTGNITIPLAVLSLTLPGSSFLYYGQELGMRNWVDGGNDPGGQGHVPGTHAVERRGRRRLHKRDSPAVHTRQR